MFSNEACILPFSCREDAGFAPDILQRQAQGV
jgi:hypothetical protein